MSAQVKVQLVCDPCGVEIVVNSLASPTVIEHAREAAAKQGWSYEEDVEGWPHVDGVDFCPHCTGERKEGKKL